MKHFLDKNIGLTLLVFVLCIGFSACTPSVIESTSDQLFSTESVNQDTAAPIEEVTMSPTSLPSPTITQEIIPTQTMLLTFTPEPTPDPMVEAAELISAFEIYDAFSDPFDPSQWENFDDQPPGLFSFRNQYGVLAAEMDPEVYGYVGFFLQIPQANLTSELYGISVDIPIPSDTLPHSLAGIRIALTDGNATTYFQCGIVYEPSGGSYLCGVYDLHQEQVTRRLANIFVSINEAHRLQIEWLPDSGLVLFFLNGRLISYVEMDHRAPVYLEKAGLFCDRWFPYAGGTRRFSNLRLGAIQQTSLNIPDDLLPKEPLSTDIYAENGLQYRLVSDFDEVVLDGVYDFEKWSIIPEQSFVPNKEEAPNLMTFTQKNGMMQFSGHGGVDFSMALTPAALRAVKMDIIPLGDEMTNGQVMFQLYVPGVESLPVEYICLLEFYQEKSDVISCFSVASSGELLGGSEYLPLPEGKPFNLEMRYEDSSSDLVAVLNDEEIHRIQVLPNQSQILGTRMFEFNLLIGNLDFTTLGIDNFIVGVKP